jgi:hypothetical protein
VVMAKSASCSWGDLIDRVRSTTGHVCRLSAIKTHHGRRIDRDGRGTAVTRTLVWIFFSPAAWVWLAHPNH